jgi:hypothetical protein
MTWAFARERGLPGSQTIAKVGILRPSLQLLPLNNTGPCWYSPSYLFYLSFRLYQPAGCSNQHRILHRISRSHFSCCRRILLYISSIRQRHASQAFNNTGRAYTLWPFPSGTCRSPSNHPFNNIQYYRRLLLILAGTAKSYSAIHELVLDSLWGYFDFMPGFLGCLRQEGIRWSTH